MAYCKYCERRPPDTQKHTLSKSSWSIVSGFSTGRTTGTGIAMSVALQAAESSKEGRQLSGRPANEPTCGQKDDSHSEGPRTARVSKQTCGQAFGLVGWMTAGTHTFMFIPSMSFWGTFSIERQSQKTTTMTTITRMSRI